MISIYGKKHSINVRKVLWLLKITNIEHFYFEDVTYDTIQSLNPNGLVPILKDDDFILWESNSILRYISNKFNLNDLYSVNPEERAHIDMWLDWQASDFNNSWVYSFQSIIRKSPIHIDTKSIENSKVKWNKCINIINDKLKTSQFIASDTFTLADIVITISLNRWYMSIGEKGIFKNVDNYFARLSTIVGFKEIVDNGTP